MVIVLSILLTILAYYFSKKIRGNFNKLIVVTTLLGIASMFLEVDPLILIVEGTAGLAFFVVVMMTGALQKGSNLSKRLHSVRKEYSILGFILLVPHFTTYLVKFLNGSMTWEFFGVIAMVVMIPLFITSFKVIKSKMDMKNWKKLQRWSYLVYATIFIHLILVASSVNAVIYTVIFAGYSILKLKNYIFNNNETLKIASSVSVLLLASFYIVLMQSSTFALSNLYKDYEGIDYTEESLIDGTYNGTGSGFKGDNVLVEVEVINGEIDSIDIIDCGCTGSHEGVNIMEETSNIANSIIENQSTDLDGISGATKSTEGVLEAVEDALKKKTTTWSFHFILSFQYDSFIWLKFSIEVISIIVRD